MFWYFVNLLAFAHSRSRVGHWSENCRSANKSFETATRVAPIYLACSSSSLFVAMVSLTTGNTMPLSLPRFTNLAEAALKCTTSRSTTCFRSFNVLPCSCGPLRQCAGIGIVHVRKRSRSNVYTYYIYIYIKET